MMNNRQTASHLLRADAAKAMTEVLGDAGGLSESAIAERMLISLRRLPATLPDGWYDPPAHGIAVLIGEKTDDFERTRFDTLRNPSFAPSTQKVPQEEAVTIIYTSPVGSAGMIGDWGLTLYKGSDELVRKHIATCLQTVESLTEYAEVGRALGDISRYAGTLIADRGLSAERKVLTNAGAATGVNCGHTIPWSNAPSTAEELAVIQSGDQQQINQLIASKRAFLNENETTVIGNDISFTTELCLESKDNPLLPNVFFHLLVSFSDGEKTISSNYAEAFPKLGMDYLRPKY